MIQVNLIPDVKRDLLKAQAIRNWVIFLSTIIGAGSIAVVVLAGITFGGLALTVGLNENNIKSKFEELSKTSDLNETIIVQSQLNEIKNIRDSAPNTSRILGQITTGIKTEGDNEVTFSGLIYEPTSKTISIEGQTSKGYQALEAFKKTIKETKIFYRDEAKGHSCSVSDALDEQNGCHSVDLTEDGNVSTLENSIGDSDEGGKVLRFKISFVLNSVALKFSTKDFAIKSPVKKDVTDSKTVIGDNIFKASTLKEEK